MLAAIFINSPETIGIWTKRRTESQPRGPLFGAMTLLLGGYL